MILPSLLAGLTEVRGALAADLQGRVVEAGPGEAEAGAAAARAAALVGALSEAGHTLGLGGPSLVSLRGATGASVLAVAGERLVRVEVASALRAAAVEKALGGWAAPDAAAPEPAAVPPAPPPPPAAPAPRAAAPAEPPPRLRRVTPPPVVPLAPTPPPMPAVVAPPAAPRSAAAQPAARSGQSPWAALRNALARGHLTEAAVRQRALVAAGVPHGGPGGEAMTEAELTGAIQQLVEGIGSVLAGDTPGAGRTLRDLASAAQPNLSIRWAALHWSARAALGSGSLGVARQHVKDALAVSRLLEVGDRAMSQLVAAELLARGGDPAKALTWLSESRSRFERVADRWGLGQTWLAEARVLAEDPAAGEERCAEAARRAWEADPEWDGPPIFLAGRALMRGELEAAESILGGVETPAADRTRRLVDAVRKGVVSQPDLADFLRVSDAPPSPQSIRILERITQAAPRFLQAREALGWALLKMGRYAEAQGVFDGLVSLPLAPGDRAVVQLGLSCIASAASAGPDALAPAEEGRPAPRLSDSAVQRAAALGVDAVLSGRLAVFQLPDLMEFLRSARRTGLLVLSSEAGLASMRFRDGFISSASSPATPGLGAVLARAGKLPDGAGPAEGEPDASLGERLIREGRVDADAVREAVREQIELTLRELLHWKDGEFAFSRESQPGAQEPVQVDAQTLLLTLYKEMDEASRGPVAAGAPA